MKRKQVYRISIIIISLFVIIAAVYGHYKLTITENNTQPSLEELNNLYNECLKNENIETLEIYNKKQEIDQSIHDNNYLVSVKYEDLSSSFDYEYNANIAYYGASLIKLLDAIYLINKAIANEIDLDTETVVYTKNYKHSYSAGLETRKYGEAITLRDLIRYAISVSDNSAHFMLMDYIGYNTLQEYGRNLGAKVVLYGYDLFGYQIVDDTNIYLKEAYRIITENAEYGPFLKEIMDNNDRNSLSLDNVKIYHKYGAYGMNYHDIGLSLDEEYPYAISIFTLHEDRDYFEVVQSIHQKIWELHNMFIDTKKQVCSNKVYRAK